MSSGTTDSDSLPPSSSMREKATAARTIPETATSRFVSSLLLFMISSR